MLFQSTGLNMDAPSPIWSSTRLTTYLIFTWNWTTIGLLPSRFGSIMLQTLTILESSQIEHEFLTSITDNIVALCLFLRGVVAWAAGETSSSVSI